MKLTYTHLRGLLDRGPALLIGILERSPTFTWFRERGAFAYRPVNDRYMMAALAVGGLVLATRLRSSQYLYETLDGMVGQELAITVASELSGSLSYVFAVLLSIVIAIGIDISLIKAGRGDKTINELKSFIIKLPLVIIPFIVFPISVISFDFVIWRALMDLPIMEGLTSLNTFERFVISLVLMPFVALLWSGIAYSFLYFGLTSLAFTVVTGYFVYTAVGQISIVPLLTPLADLVVHEVVGIALTVLSLLLSYKSYSN